MSAPRIETVVVGGRPYRVRMLGATRLKELGLMSDEEERLIHKSMEMARTRREDPSLTLADVGTLLTAHRRIARHCVLTAFDDLPTPVMVRLVGQVLAELPDA